MGGEIDVMRLAEGADLEKARDAAAAGDVGLQHVHRFGLEQDPRIVEIVGIFAGGDGHAGRRAVAHQAETGRIVGGDRLLEPADIGLATRFDEAQRRLHRKSAVAVDEKLVVADGAPGGHRPLGVALGIAADFHFDEATAVNLGPMRKLLAQLLVGIGGEAAAAVDHHLVAAAAEKGRQRQAHDARLEVPERRIEGGNGAGGEFRAAEIAHLALHRQHAARNVEAVLPLERLLGDRLNQRGDAGVRVGVAEARLIAGLDVHDDQSRRIPGERAVRLGTVGWNL